MVKTAEVSLIEIAQQCNVSVREIHAAAKQLGQELNPTARSIDGSLAKKIVAFFMSDIDERSAKKEKQAKKEKKEKAPKKPDSKSKSEVKSKVEAVKTVKEEPKKPDRAAIFGNSKPVEYLIEEKVEEKKSEKPHSAGFDKKKVFDKFKKPLQQVQKTKQRKEDPKNQEKSKSFDTFKPASIEKETKKTPHQKVDTTVSDELLGLDEANGPKDTAEIYDELIAEEREREIVHSQRKKTAGKDAAKQQIKRAQPTVSQTLKYDPNRIVEIPDVISVKEFAEKSGLGAAKIIGELMKNGILANINQQIDYDTAAIIAVDLNVKIKKKQTFGSAEDLFKGDLASLMAEQDDTDLQERPAIVVVMGHVDHGKTSLLDAIREANVVSTESGGITQHIGAYQVEKNQKKITFIDTPGHEAFTAMRARGAKVTDIAILVVAADEGIKPQTVEAIQHAKDADVPIIVAINKIDKPGADPDRVKGELAAYDLTPEDWGGTTIMVPVSALTKQGIPQLLEMILLVAEMENLKANFGRAAIGTVIETNLDKSMGPVATVIVNTGTLKIMDNVVVGETWGRIKVMKDHRGKNIRIAAPSTPVLIAGLAEQPMAGDILQVVPDERIARSKSISIKNMRQAQQRERGLGEIMSAITSGQLKQLKLVLKADTTGSLEAIKQMLGDIKHESVGVKVILSGVGDVAESDVMMAAASGGLVLGFHVKVPAQVNALAERENVEIAQYEIIYKLIDDVKKILTGLLEPEMIEKELGEMEAKMIFFSKKKEMIIGCYISSGVVQNKTKLRVFRNNELVGETQIVSLQKNQDSLNEIKEGNECGIKIHGGNVKIEVGDILRPYKIEKKMRTL